MPRVSLNIPHALGKEEAMRRLKEKFSVVRGTYQSQVRDLEEQWDDNVLRFGFKVMGMKVSGTVTVEGAAVMLAADVPLAALPLRGMIEKQVRAELSSLLA